MTARYVVPSSVDDAVAELVDHADAWLLAGGTDLLVQTRAAVVSPGRFIDIKRLGLAGISRTATHLRIGALTTHATVASDPDVLALCPMLATACRSVGGPATRNRGTLAGNIVNASPAADAVAALLALGAELVVVGPQGERTIALDQLYLGYREVALARGDIVVRVDIPVPELPTGEVFHKVGLRNAMAIAVVSVACRIAIDPGRLISGARIALGSVAPTVVRAPTAEAVLRGRTLAEMPIVEAARAAMTDIRPISDLRSSGAYRSRAAEVWLARCLQLAREDLESSHA